MHKAADVIALFNRCFKQDYKTLLVGGGDEPLYLPQGRECAYHRIIFRADYFASALHEVAHWCVAGSERRLQEDYGYWYAPDGRTALQQQEFERVEVKPQALEWLFSRASASQFRVSADNLHGAVGASPAFKHAIANQVQLYCREGLSARPMQFVQALAKFYKVQKPFEASVFDVHYLD